LNQKVFLKERRVNVNKQRFMKDGLVGDDNGTPALVGHQCADCSRKFFPAVELCPYCASENVEKIFLSREAKVLAASTTRVPVPPYKAPFTLAIIDIDDDIRTIGRIEKEENVTIKKGDQLTLKIGKLWEETVFNKEIKANETIDVIGYYYIPKN
jgi:uncharacterized OB-fold protein